MIKYKTRKYQVGIEKVQVERETEKCVWIKMPSSNIRKTLKRSDYESYFDTFEEAKQFYVDEANNRLAKYQSIASEALFDLNEAMDLKDTS